MKIIMALIATTLAFNCAAQTVPSHDCTAPNVPNRQAADVVVKQFNKRLTAYTACINKYVDSLTQMQKATNDPATLKEIEDKYKVAMDQYNAVQAEVKKNSTGGEDE